HTDLIFGTDAFNSIQAAVTAATANDIIQVGPGTFNETVSISKTLTLEGAQYLVSATDRTGAPESIVTNANGAFSLLADNVAVSGFTIEGQTGGSLEAGIATSPTKSGYLVSNNIITDNVVGLKLNTAVTNASVVKGNHFFGNDNA